MDPQTVADSLLDTERRHSDPAVRRLHALHPYPGMLARHIVRATLGGAWPDLSVGDDTTVFDPFCGAGSVLVEAKLAGIRSTGWDSNPLACLVSRVKTQSLSPAALARSLGRLDRRVSAASADPPQVVNLAYWYEPATIEGLSRLANYIADLVPCPTNDVLRLSLSKTAMELSLANPRFPVPVKLRPDRYTKGSKIRERLDSHLERARTADPVERFRFHVERIGATVFEVQKRTRFRDVGAAVAEHDARQATALETPASLVVTSPPYPGAQKYTRFSSLSLGWLRLAAPTELRTLEDRLIGRDHFPKSSYTRGVPSTGLADADALLSDVAGENALRAHIGATYLNEMREAVKVIADNVRRDADVVLIVAPSQFVGRVFDTPGYLEAIARDCGLELHCRTEDQIRSRRLVTSRRGDAAPMASEHILHFKALSP